MARDNERGEPTKERATTGPDSPKPGSDPAAAKEIGGKGDFGVPVAAGRTRERDYVSGNTKAADPGAAQAHSGEGGDRTSGVGGNQGGPGASSGGDIDPDLLGFGAGGTVAASGTTHRPPGPDDSDGSSNEFASGAPAEGRNQADAHHVGGSKRVHGSTVNRDGGVESAPSGQGADAATNPARGDDSFAGEVSSGEAGGQGGV